eukprot:CAMPEP_0204875164 /NCGR_PEP_ID=MMETSP1348-20121228/45225_1 /ASSEMBLY_ACC=CAM_ASM_000700 /TAXON_ID=215587 /ORGANISM="Aplanochytrium stocchinoi, Strain GSBS06" /LENGTH=584 /DNA_ID=CAMNT_0052031445 /DNA_START=159 /DNA_END=1913 /DNA_ORIENTATION=-
MVRSRKEDLLNTKKQRLEIRKVDNNALRQGIGKLIRSPNGRWDEKKKKVSTRNKGKSNVAIKNKGEASANNKSRNTETPRTQRKVEPLEIVREYDRNLLFEANRDDNALTLSLWDFGGQKVFYSMHHIFMTATGMYLVIFDMRELFQESKKDESLKYMSFWLKSIKLHAPTAPLLIVGTFLHDVHSKEQLKAIENMLKGFPETLFTQLVHNEEADLLFFPIDNKENLGVAKLRKCIEGVVREDESVLQEVPIKWLVFLDEILNRRKTESYLTLRAVKQLAADIGITSAAEQEKALQMFHEKGMLIHLTSTAALNDIVTIKPQWLIDNISNVIRDDSIHMFDITELKKMELLEEVETMFSRAVASRDVLEYVWKEDEIEFFVDLMKRTLLMSDWSFGGEENRFLIPSLLNKVYDIGEIEKGIRCVFDFSDSFLPNGVFERLLCLCVAHSTSPRSAYAKQGYSAKEPKLYKNFCTIEFGPDNTIRLHVDEDSDTLSCCMENLKSAERNLAIISSMIQKLNTDVMGTGLKWTVLLEDPSNGKLISHEDAFQKRLSPWFQEKNAKEVGTSGKTQNSQGLDIESFLDQL